MKTFFLGSWLGLVLGLAIGVFGYRYLLRRLHYDLAQRWIEKTKLLSFSPSRVIDGVFGAHWLGMVSGIASVTGDERLEREADGMWTGWMDRTQSVARREVVMPETKKVWS